MTGATEMFVYSHSPYYRRAFGKSTVRETQHRTGLSDFCKVFTTNTKCQCSYYCNYSENLSA